MHRNDRPALIALALMLLAIIVLATIEVSIRNAPADPPAYSESSGVDQQHANDSPQGRSEDGHFFGDSVAQWVMALFTVLATVISGVAVKLVNDTLKTSRTATNAAVEAVAVTRDIGERQIRPYIVHEKATVVLIRPKDGQPNYLEVTVHIRNCGVTPGIITAVSAAVYAPVGDGNWGQKGGSWRRTRMALGPNQSDTLKFKGLEATQDGTFTWFMIGILVWYSGVDGTEHEDPIWLTFDGQGVDQGYPDMGFALYRPEHDPKRK